jgi:hypothetical protein
MSKTISSQGDNSSHQDTPEASLIETIGTSDLGDIGINISEAALDALQKDGLFRDIPIVSTVVGLVKLGGAIRDYVFLKKLMRFLHHLNDIPQQEREAFINELRSEKQAQRVGENLLLLIDRYDHYDKITLMAKLFGGYVAGEIDYGQFIRFSLVVDRAFVEDLREMLDYYSGNRIGQQRLWENLFSCGLSNVTINLRVDGETRIVMSDRPVISGGELISFQPNADAPRMAHIVLGERFVHPAGWVWVGDKYWWKPDSG